MKGKEGTTDFIGPDNDIAIHSSAAGNSDYRYLRTKIEACGHEPWWGRQQSCMLRTLGSRRTLWNRPSRLSHFSCLTSQCQGKFIRTKQHNYNPLRRNCQDTDVVYARLELPILLSFQPEARKILVSALVSMFLSAPAPSGWASRPFTLLFYHPAEG